jgi:hypothetical protein
LFSSITGEDNGWAEYWDLFSSALIGYTIGVSTVLCNRDFFICCDDDGVVIGCFDTDDGRSPASGRGLSILLASGRGLSISLTSGRGLSISLASGRSLLPLDLVDAEKHIPISPIYMHINIHIHVHVYTFKYLYKYI